MKFTETQKTGFFNAVESLKKYRRADLIDERGRNLLEKLYVDLLPNGHILAKSLLNNTTILIGRKGTGKSTIFLRLEQELRKKNDYLSCYIDVKTIYESSQTKYKESQYLKELVPTHLIEKYLIERTFIQNVLTEIQKELNNKYNSLGDRILKTLFGSKTNLVEKKLNELKEKIQNNEVLKNIEIPVLKKIISTNKINEEQYKETNKKIGGIEGEVELKPYTIRTGMKTGSGIVWKNGRKEITEIENQFPSVFLQIFQIKDIIQEIKEILQSLKISHLFVLLDDFSEIDDDAIKSFVDVILAPLNNWSDEFIKFKVAAYPGRFYYGKIDPGKIDTIYLDFYSLYSEFDRNKMEENAIDFTKRLILSRISHFANSNPEVFFDVKSQGIEEYYNLFFTVSMNVPRILGYILSYCYQSKIIYDRLINKSDIEAATQKYYEDKIEPFFDTTTYSLLSIDEKISTLQFKDLLLIITDKLTQIRKRISTRDLKGEIYSKTMPFSSHFHLDPRLEEFLKTLELNFFISKYNDLSDKDGNPVSIFCVNYGLAVKLNIPWGKPIGNKYRKYFIERPFNLTKTIKGFLSQAKKIHCINPDCRKSFSVDELKYLEFTNFKCNDCGCKVIIESIAPEIKDKIEKIEESKLLPLPELKILRELEKADQLLFAKDIAQEIDYSGQLIGWRCKKLDEEHFLVKRTRRTGNSPYRYELTNKGKDYFS